MLVLVLTELGLDQLWKNTMAPSEMPMPYDITCQKGVDIFLKILWFLF
jgi:hypothetical protein